jgi:hypothetical protein
VPALVQFITYAMAQHSELVALVLALAQQQPQ